MAIRKEQVLVLLTLGMGALLAPGYFRAVDPPRKASSEPLDYTPAATREVVLVTTVAPAPTRRDPCIEPSETQPLPPRDIQFPPRPPLSVVALPLEPGPDPGRYSLLAIDGAPVTGVSLSAGGAAATGDEPPPAESEAAPPSRADAERIAALGYDRIYAQGLQSPFFGTIVAGKDVDLYALEKATDFTGVVLRLRSYDPSKRRLGEMRTFGGDGMKIDHIVLAGTLRNEVQRRLRSTSGAPTARRELVAWLIEQARTESWVHEEALRQARAYREQNPTQDGWRVEQMVLRARGDLAGEVALLEGLATTGPDAGYRFEGLGNAKAQLGLWLEAEADLRQATKLAPGDARVLSSLAEFLRSRGRSSEALAVAKAAEVAIGTATAAEDVVRVVRTVLSCKLAMGDVAGARAALSLLPSGHAQPYLAGCIAYVAGDDAAALASFRQATGADSGAAQLGQAACLIRTGQWQEAHDLLVRVADQEPLLRHRAHTGLALLWARLGQYEPALSAVDRALEADPQDPYAHYLRGRCMRLSGQVGAEEALRTTLRLRDDFVHTIAEMSLAKAARATGTPGPEQAAAVVAARRYADRAVQLAEPARRELWELQGLQAFHAADPTAAAAAFVRARDAVSDDRNKAYAKGALAVVDYSRGLVDDAAIVLQRLVQDLPKDDGIALWAEATVAAIFDHAQKEMLSDGFGRDLLGTIWVTNNDVTLAPKLRDGKLQIRGPLSRTGRGERLGDPGMVEVWAERMLAVAKGRNFLAVGAKMTQGSGQSATDGFAGLGVELLRGGGSGGFDFQALLGVRNGKPFLRLADGRNEGAADPQVPLTIPDFDPRAEQSLELRVEARGEKQFTLLVVWGGLVVHRHELKALTGNTGNELKTFLFASGSRGGEVDVAFDDYHLERRKDA